MSNSPMTLRTIIAVGLLMIVTNVASAQTEHALWYFGEYAGLDFRGGGAPVAVNDSRDNHWEGTATMCDPRTGRMLFHTDGDTVWNRNWSVMPNGTLLGGHISSTQAALILPMPEDSTKFYIISTDAANYYSTGPAMDGAVWAIVDMSLNGGLGDVTRKNVLLHTPVAEKVTAVPHCNGRGYWLILHELKTDRYVIYYLSKHGFEGPRFVSIGSVHSGTNESGIGGMKFNTSGTRLATAVFVSDLPGYSKGHIDLLDFNRNTGELSNPITVPMTDFVYDVCFSPDATKLYVTGEQHRYVAQLDVRGRTGAEIAATKVELFRSRMPGIAYENTGHIQIGDDGRLYVAIKDVPQISVINRPNSPGLASGYAHRAIDLNGRYSNLGLPNFVYGLYDETLLTCKPPRSRFTVTDTRICAGESITFVDQSVDEPMQWEWTFPGGTPSSATRPDPGSVRYDVPGVYRAMLVTQNGNGSDTFAIDVTVNPRPVVDAGPDQRVCIGNGVRIELSAKDAATYAWTPAAGLSCTTCPQPIASPTSTTRYTVVATSSEGCVSSDDVTIVVDPYPVVDAGDDVEMCLGESVQLDGQGGTDFAWSPSTGLSCTTCPNPIAAPSVSTTYTLTSTIDGRCAAVDSIRVTVHPLPVADAGNDARICAGDPVQLRASGGVRYEWSPATGLSCSDCASPIATVFVPTTYIVRAFNATGCSSIDSMHIDVDPSPQSVTASLGPDIDVYPGIEIELPVVLERPLDDARVSVVDLAVTYDPTIMHLQRATLDSSLTEGWTVIVTSEDRDRGVFAARLFAVGETLTGTGVLARLRFQTFINRGDSAIADLGLTLPGKGCTRVLTRPVVVRLDSVCGLNHRLIESTGSSYALHQNTPNPFNPSTSIDFSLGLDGDTRVEIFDARGRRVALLVDAYLRAGAYAVTWDASTQPSGLYICRVTSGSWTRSMPMTVSK